MSSELITRIQREEVDPNTVIFKVVQVIRCGECKHFIREDEECGECDLYHQPHSIKFYCADGEWEYAGDEPIK